MEIMIVTDYVCPWCYAAEELLRQALARTRRKLTVTIQPYELSPEGTPAVDTYNDPDRRRHYIPLLEACEKMGLHTHIPPKVIPRPRTRLAFEGRYFAEEQGLEFEWDRAVFRAYFDREEDIGQIPVLMGCAAEAGLDPEALKEALESGTYTAREQEAVAYARNWLTFSGVPAFFVDDKPVTLKDYTVDEMLQVLWGFTGSGLSANCDENSCEV